MSTFNFKPIVELTESGALITAPHEIKERIWKELETAEDIVRKLRFDIPEYSHTQIKLAPLPGYEPFQAYLFAWVCSYIVVSPDDVLQNFWRTPLADHHQMMCELVNASDHAATFDEIAPVLTWWLRYAIWNDIKQRAAKLTGLKIKPAMDKSLVKAWYNNALSAYRRLKFDNRLSDVSKAMSLSEAYKLLKELGQKAEEIASAYEAIEQLLQLDDLVASFKPHIDSADSYPAVTRQDDWRNAQDTLEDIEEYVSKVAATIKLEEARKIYESILEITPEPPPTPIVKN